MAALLALLFTLLPSAIGSGTGLLAAWHSNAVLAPSSTSSDNCSGAVDGLSLKYTTSAEVGSGCKSTSAAQRPSLGLFSARFDGTITAPSAGSWEFRIVTNGAVRFWIDDHIIIDSSCDDHSPASAAATIAAQSLPALRRTKGFNCYQWDVPDPEAHSTAVFAGRDNVTHHIEKGLHLRLEWLHYGGGPANLQLLWRPGTPSMAAEADGRTQPFVPVPSSALTPVVKHAELWRQGLQAKLSRGWNTWMRDNAMRHIHLPSGFGVEVQLWDIPTADSSDDSPPPSPLPSPSGPVGTLEEDIDFTGGDLSGLNHKPGHPCAIKAANITGCVNHCQQLPYCVAVTMRPPPGDESLSCCNFKCDTAGKHAANGSKAVVVRPKRASGGGTCAASLAAPKQVDIKGLVDKCKGADADSCKIIAGHHSFNGSATSFVQRTGKSRIGHSCAFFSRCLILHTSCSAMPPQCRMGPERQANHQCHHLQWARGR